MKTKRILALFLATVMLVSALLSCVVITASAEETEAPAVSHPYVTDGLVALYSGTQNTRAGHDNASTVWEDLVGGHDVNVTVNETNYFTENGLQLKAAQNNFPQAIVDTVNGQAFTVEISMANLVSTADAYSTIMNSTNDNFALFRRISSDVLEFKFAANAAPSRNTITDCLNLLQDAVITITYEVGGESCIYINGELMSAMPSPNAMGANDLFFGHSEAHRHFEALYRSIRFYDRALTESEILQNCIAEGQLSVADLYVTDGLVSLYSGMNSGADDAVWEDLVGDNDLPITINDKNYFTEEGLLAEGTQHYFPQAIVDLVNGNEFSVELSFGDFTSIGGSFNTFLNSRNDNFALFRRNANDNLEFKWAGKPGEARPKVGDGLNLIDNGVITVTYKVGGACRVYADGELLAEVSCDTAMGADNLFIGHEDASKMFSTIYRSIRFYNRELTPAEVKTNAKADGATVVEGPTEVVPSNITVAQPQTNIVGDIALIREINTASELEKVTAAERKPAIILLTINDKLEVLSDKGAAISTVGDVFAATEYKIIPAFRVADKAAADALAEYLKSIRFYDCFVVSADPAVVKDFRTALPQVSGAIDYTETYKDAAALTEEQCLDVRRSMKSNNGTVAILPADLCANATVQYLYNRQINVWAKAADAPSERAQYHALLSGAIGVISDATDSLLDIAVGKLPKNTMTRVTLNIGHRGIPSSAPENTIEGSLLAFERGANVIELDVYLTTDGEVVVMHDGTTGRTCNADLPVEGSTLAQLKELYVNKGYESNSRYKECRIPTLKEYLEAFKDKDCQLFIEIKSSKTAIVKAVKACVDEYDMYDQCSVITFNEPIMAAMRTDYPEMSVGALCGGFMAGLDPEADLRAAMNFIGKYNATLNPSYGGFEANDIRAALLRGISIYPWTFRGDLNTYKNHLLWGYSGLTGDNANVFIRIARNISFTPASTEVSPDASLSLNLDVTYYDHETKSEAPTSVTILAGESIAQVKDGQMTFTGKGEVTFILGYEVKVGTDTVILHSQPVTVTVTEAGTEETTAPETETAEPMTGEVTEPTVTTDSSASVTTESAGNSETDGGEDKKGCASAIGGMAVILMALAAGIAWKKKDE